jgi:phytoene dehydrogenase-like protein
LDVHVLEASDGVGGRVRTDQVDGFLLDRGFQVLLTAYEEVQTQVDMEALELHSFRPGGLVWDGKGLVHLSDPWREPATALASLRSKIGTLKDKMTVASMRHRVLSKPPEACFNGRDRSTQQELEALGLSRGFIDAFFRPFLGGVFLERALETSAHLFRYYFRCFSAGNAALPAGGMVRLPEQLARTLTGRITLGCRVERVSGSEVVVRGRSTMEAGHVVLAVDGAAAANMLGEAPVGFKAAVTSYFASPEPPTDLPLLILDGEGTGPANHVAVLSNVAPGYAPPGSHLISVSGVDGAAEDPLSFQRDAPKQLRRWFGSVVDHWEHLRTYRIPHALPRHPAGSLPTASETRVRPDGLLVAGDYTEFGAIQGALLSGRRAAEAILRST